MPNSVSKHCGFAIKTASSRYIGCWVSLRYLTKQPICEFQNRVPFKYSITEGFRRCFWWNPTDGVFALACCPSFHQRDKATSWKNAICWILKFDFCLAGNQYTTMLLIRINLHKTLYPAECSQLETHIKDEWCRWNCLTYYITWHHSPNLRWLTLAFIIDLGSCGGHWNICCAQIPLMGHSTKDKWHVKHFLLLCKIWKRFSTELLANENK